MSTDTTMREALLALYDDYCRALSPERRVDSVLAKVEAALAAPSERTPTELGAALKAKLDEAAPSAIPATGKINDVPVAQTGERSQQGNGSEIASPTRPRVAEVAGATPVRDSSPLCGDGG